MRMLKLNLNRLRKERGLTQAELGRLIGVTAASISNYELGVCYPRMRIVFKLSVALGVSVAELLGQNVD